MKILLTGGLGYISSNTCVELIAVGNEVVIVDNPMRDYAFAKIGNDTQ